MMRRTWVYVDGFNLYFGLVDSGLGACRWLDIWALAEKLLPSDDCFVAGVTYYTARLQRPAESQQW